MFECPVFSKGPLLETPPPPDKTTEVAEVERQLRILKEEGKVDKEPIGKPHDGWCILENPIKMDDLGGTTIFFGNIHLYTYL